MESICFPCLWNWKYHSCFPEAKILSSFPPSKLLSSLTKKCTSNALSSAFIHHGKKIPYLNVALPHGVLSAAILAFPCQFRLLSVHSRPLPSCIRQKSPRQGSPGFSPWSTSFV